MFFRKKRAASSAASIAGAPGRAFVIIEKLREVRTRENKKTEKREGPRSRAARGNTRLAAPAARRAESLSARRYEYALLDSRNHGLALGGSRPVRLLHVCDALVQPL